MKTNILVATKRAETDETPMHRRGRGTKSTYGGYRDGAREFRSCRHQLPDGSLFLARRHGLLRIVSVSHIAAEQIRSHMTDRHQLVRDLMKGKNATADEKHHGHQERDCRSDQPACCNDGTSHRSRILLQTASRALIAEPSRTAHFRAHSRSRFDRRSLPSRYTSSPRGSCRRESSFPESAPL